MIKEEKKKQIYMYSYLICYICYII